MHIFHKWTAFAQRLQPGLEVFDTKTGKRMTGVCRVCLKLR